MNRPTFQQRLMQWWYGTLSRQIVLPALVATLGFLTALGFVAFRLGQSAVEDQVTTRNRQIANQVGNEISSLFQIQLDVLRLQESRLLDRTFPSRQGDALLTLRSQFPYIYNDLRLFDFRGSETVVLTGTLTEALNRGPQRFINAPPSHDVSVQRALEDNAIQISPVAFRTLTNSPYVTLTLPLGSCTTTAACPDEAVLQAQLDLRSFWTRVDGVRIDGGTVFIVDQRGTILAHPERQRVGERLDLVPLAPVLAGFEGSTTYQEDGRDYLAAYAPLGPPLNWGVIVAQERSLALVDVSNIGFAATLATLLSAACMVILLTSFVRRAVEPVSELSQAAAAIAVRGNLLSDEELALPRDASSSEIAALASSFAQMIDRLRGAQHDLRLWNEALERRVAERTAELETVLEVARLSSGSLDVRAVLTTLLEELERVVDYNVAALALLDSSGKALEIAAASGVSNLGVRRIPLDAYAPRLSDLVQRKIPWLIGDLSNQPPWPGHLGPRSGSWIAVRLEARERTVGVLMMFATATPFYTSEDANLLTALAGQVAIALSHAQLYTESVQRVEHEFHVARQVQRQLFPTAAPPLRGLEVATFYQPARETTGDFYAFVKPPQSPDESATQTSFDLIIGDVSGKSLPAALLMAMARTALYAAATQQPDPAEALRAANRVLVGDMPHGSFVAASFARFRHDCASCLLVNAAQPAPLLIRRGDVQLLEGQGSHLPLGIVATVAYETLHIQLEPGDHLLFYTDGVIEAHNPSGALFGFEQLMELSQICVRDGFTPRQTIDRIIEAVVAWGNGTPQHDDIAMVLVRVTADWPHPTA